MEAIKESRQSSDMKIMLRTVTVIALCFLLTSTGWLSWEYHLLDQIPAHRVDMYTMVIGYLLQAAGIGLFAYIIKRKPDAELRILRCALILHMIFMVPAVMSPFTPASLIFGSLMNIACGLIAGCYLFELTKYAPADRKAVSFGIGYAIAILAGWLLSIVDGGRIYYSEKVLLICVLLTALVIAVPIREGSASESKTVGAAKGRGETLKSLKKIVATAGVLVLLFSMVNGSAFAFPAADLGGAVKVELSRLFYAAGLIIAGLVTDRSRKVGAICALTALMMPFIILSLRGESVSVIIFWALSYFTFGFYAVYRIILFSDMAAKRGLMYLSVFGLMIGRTGDALGEVICLLLGDRLAPLVIVTAALFAAAVSVFFITYQRLYVPEGVGQQSEKERFAAFAAEHDLSSREQDVLRLLLDKRNNVEIAETLFISENTVKFHIRNLLQKTGCKNRNELVTAYELY